MCSVNGSVLANIGFGVIKRGSVLLWWVSELNNKLRVIIIGRLTEKERTGRGA